MRRQSDGADFGAWLIKCNPRRRDFERLLAEAQGISQWCVTRSYRTRMIRSGQPVLLWVSGGGRTGPSPGIWAAGETVSSAWDADLDPAIDPSREPGAKCRVQVDFRLLDEPIPRTLLRQVAGLERLEVLRMPAGSNPSWVTSAEFKALRGLPG